MDIYTATEVSYKNGYNVGRAYTARKLIDEFANMLVTLKTNQASIKDMVQSDYLFILNGLKELQRQFSVESVIVNKLEDMIHEE